MAAGLAYIIEEESSKEIAKLGFPKIEERLLQSGFQASDIGVQHYMVLHKSPLRYNPEMPKTEMQEYYAARIRFRSGPGIGRSDYPLDEALKLAFDYVNGRWGVANPPYFFVTQPELAEELEKMLGRLGIEFKKLEKKQEIAFRQ